MLKGSSILVATLYLPLFVHTTKSHTTKGKVIFNLNNYRNMFHTKSNNAKKEMKQLIANMKVPHLGSGPFELEYTYYHGNRRVMDVSNAGDGCVLSTIYPTNNIGKTTVRYELCRILGGEICEAHYEEGELHQLQIKKV